MERKNDSSPHGRYARILIDYWFKRSFGSERWKRLMQLFLEEVIPERKIEELTFVSQEHLNASPEKKGIRVDVECKDQDGARFIVEMQLAQQSHFYERAVFYSSFAIQDQLILGESRYDFEQIYFIGLLDFSPHKDSDRVLFRYDIRERETHELMTDRVQYIFLELPNCKRALTPEASILDNFCYALHNMERIPEKPMEMDSELFQLLFDSAEIANFTPDEKKKYDLDMRTERDFKNQLAYAKEEGLKEGMERGIEKGLEKGIEKGIERGIEQGREEGRISERDAIAQRLLAKGMTQEEVDSLLGSA